MAQDIIPMDPWTDKCPWCGKPILIERQLATYEDGEAEQFVGLEKSPVTLEEIKRVVRTAPPKRKRR